MSVKGGHLILGIAVFAAGYVLAWQQYRPAPDGPQIVAAEDILARVGNRVITRDMFEQALELRAKRNPQAYARLEARRALLEQLVERTALLMAAEKAGLADEPMVREACERAVINRFTHDKLEKQLQNLEVDESMLQAYYQQHKEELAVPARYKPAIILLPAPTENSSDAWNRLEAQAAELLEQARQLPDGVNHFAELARTYSAHRASRYQGGALAWVNSLQKNHTTLPTPVLDALFSLQEPGELAEPVRTNRGVYLIRLMAWEPGRVRPLAEVRTALEYRLRREMKEQSRKQILERYLGKQAIEIWPERLDGSEHAVPTTADHIPPALPRQGKTTEKSS